MNLFITYLFRNPQYFLIWLLVVVFSICCHEFMHAWVALRQGDPTAADAGHLTLNPFKQMGWMSLFMLALCGIAWGAVPVRPSMMRHRHSDALVSFAGPATNLGLFLIFGFIFYLCRRAEIQNSAAYQLLFLGSMLNLVLFLFNMLPIPGFDGFSILSSFWPRLREFHSEWLTGVYFIIFFLVFLSFDYLWAAAEYLLALWIHGLNVIFGA